MKLDGYKKRLAEHQARIDRLERSGEMAKLYAYNPRRFRKLYQRLGFLKQKVEGYKEQVSP